MSKTAKAAKANKAKEILTAGVTELLNGDAFKKALDFRKNFHQYSMSNCMLIYMQNPEASMVAGYGKWQDMGRQVQKGQKALAIMAPMAKKNDDGETKIFGFRSVNVFDVSQTEGEDVPTGPESVKLTGNSEATQAAIASVTAYASEQGLTVDFEELDGPSGCYIPSDKAIKIHSGNEPTQQLKTLVHELAHAMLAHGSEESEADDYKTGELQAESTAYLVLDRLGIDSSGYSFAYIANWSGGGEDAVLAAVDVADKTAKQIIEAITA